MEGSGEEGQSPRLGEEMGRGLGWSDGFPGRGRGRGVVGASSTSAGSSLPRNVWKNACGGGGKGRSCDHYGGRSCDHRRVVM